MSEWKCVVSVQVSGDHGCLCGEREITLPFMPFKGMRIFGLYSPEMEDGGGTKIRRIAWDIDNDRFILMLEDEHDWAGTLAEFSELFAGFTWTNPYHSV